MSGSKRLVCLFAQYHPRHRVRAPVLHYVGALQACGYQTFVACSGDAPPPSEDRDALAAAGATVLCRPNLGLDFGAWQHLIGEGCADGADRVLLANDSVFGPLRPLRPVVDRMEAGGHDVWGMIESRQRSWHLQSWFLQFTGAAFHDTRVRRVFTQPFARMGKGEVIEHGELGLGRALRRAGFRCGALVRFRDATWFARRHRLNMMHLDWHHNLVVRGLPFIKAELLRDNFMRLPWAPAWDKVLQRRLGVDPSEISDFLYDYTGTVPSYPGAPFPVPVRPLSVRLLAAYVLATHDRALALRWLRLRNIRLRARPGSPAG
jgi:lipopolysaccharide biosynthesis protein